MYYDLSVHMMTCARAGQKSVLSSNLSLTYMRLQQLANKKTIPNRENPIFLAPFHLDVSQ